jgi:AcrR family transcriptional regulator
VQQRGMERVEKLLDAAGDILEQSGLAGLTTSAVAEASGSSVGVVYRYYPNIEAILLALAERNLSRYAKLIEEQTELQQPADWREYVRLCVELYADFGASTPGFPAVRFGDTLAMRYANKAATNNDQLVNALLRDLDRLYGIEPTAELLYQTQVAIEVADGLTARAFLRERAADRRFVESAVELITHLLSQYLDTREH